MPYSSFSGATDRVRAAGGGRRSRPRSPRAAGSGCRGAAASPRHTTAPWAVALHLVVSAARNFPPRSAPTPPSLLFQHSFLVPAGCSSRDRRPSLPGRHLSNSERCTCFFSAGLLFPFSWTKSGSGSMYKNKTNKQKSPVLGRNRRGWQQGAAGPGVSLGGRRGGSDSSGEDSSGGGNTRGCSEWRNSKACVNCLSPPPSAPSFPASGPPFLPPSPPLLSSPGFPGRSAEQVVGACIRSLEALQDRVEGSTHRSSGTSPRRRSRCCGYWVGRGFLVAPPLVPHTPIGSRLRKLCAPGGPRGLSVPCGLVYPLRGASVHRAQPASSRAVRKAKLPFSFPKTPIALTHALRGLFGGIITTAPFAFTE